jgi:hypothetical protein
MDETKFVVLSLEAYGALIERAVRAECAASENRQEKWRLDARVKVLENELKELRGGTSDG